MAEQHIVLQVTTRMMFAPVQVKKYTHIQTVIQKNMTENGLKITGTEKAFIFIHTQIPKKVNIKLKNSMVTMLTELKTDMVQKHTPMKAEIMQKKYTMENM